MSNTNIGDYYILAARKQFRFNSGRGAVSIEDLYALSLEALDKVAVGLDAEIQKAGGKSFVRKRASSTIDLEAQLAIVVHVIETKQQEAEDRKNRADKSARATQIRELLAEKNLEAFKNKSAEELEKELAELEA